MKKILSAVQMPIFYILAYMPTFLCRWLAKILAHQLIRRPNAYRRRIDTNLRILMPELSTEKRNKWVAENLHFWVNIFLQVPRLMIKEKQKAIRRISEIKGEELALAASREGKGVIFLSFHLGNWEVLAPYLGKKFKCTSFYRPPDNNHLHRLMSKYRNKNGIRLAPTNMGGIRLALAALKRKEVVIIMPDQNPSKHTSQQIVRFFGIDMPRPTLLTQLRARTDARVIVLFSVEISPGRYRAEFHLPPKAVYSNDTQQSAQAVASCIEKYIRLYPTQYQWSYRMLYRTKYNKEYK